MAYAFPISLAKRYSSVAICSRVIIMNRGRILAVDSPARLEEHLYDELAAPMSNVVDATVYQLRRKLAAAGAGTPLIHTRRGQGYVLEEEP